MKRQLIIDKLNAINEELGFLEEVSIKTPIIEEKLEELKTIRYEYERKLDYEKYKPSKVNQENREED
tara:strand:- start:2692 stop:2892 length:201 start_codon:yes stop_codon:yes gene_type:complete